VEDLLCGVAHVLQISPAEAAQRLGTRVIAQRLGMAGGIAKRCVEPALGRLQPAEPASTATRPVARVRKESTPNRPSGKRLVRFRSIMTSSPPSAVPSSAPTEAAVTAGPVARPANPGYTGTGQEVRFAVAMAGGVSLAVWMGGVARELNLLQQASNLRQAGKVSSGTDWDDRCRQRYVNLLNLLDVTVTTDVLSGTSAGGINAALLGLASMTGVDLGGLRDLWLTTGSMDILLRDPGEPNPPSLMQGDKVLFSQLNTALHDFYGEARRSPNAVPQDPASTTVFITTTMMSGETNRFTDDFGTLVPDVDHHGLFTFNAEDLGAGGKEPKLTELALAARSSASFPGAFEPSFVPVNSSIAAAPGVPEHPDMAAFANMTRSHWVADGGLLANRPLTPLLAKIFSQPATGQVRRVLAFVVPDGGGIPRAAPEAVPDDEWKKPLTLAAALKADLDAQLSQSIASDLEATRAHNERIKARHDLRRALADLGSRLSGDVPRPDRSPPSTDGLITGRILRDFQRQQGTDLAQPLLTTVMGLLTTMQIPAGWAQELGPGDQQSGPAEPRMAKAMVDSLGRGWQGRPPAGQAPAGVEDEAWTTWTGTPAPYQRAALFGLPVFHAARAVAVQLIRLGYQGATTSEQRGMLAGHRETIEATSAQLPAGWTGERGQVRAYLAQQVSTDLVTVAEGLAEMKRQGLLIGDGGAPVLVAAWTNLAAAIASLLADLQPLSAAAGRVSRAEAAGAIGVYLRYFDGATEAEQVADRLLKLVLAERALLPVGAELDQPVEFVQFSANTRTLLAPGNASVPASQQLDSVTKLRGVEFHHFAAFYKNSWRAWDWTWGRLDGCGWLVHILLDPRRILAVVEGMPAEAFQEKGTRAATFAALLREVAALPAGLNGDCLETDLAFLDDHTADIPVSLPRSALFLAQTWQNLIAANELPVIAEQMAPDGDRQATPPDAWVAAIRRLEQSHAPPAKFAAMLPQCPVRQETLAGELRTPAFARVATKAAAVATAAVATAPEAPGAVRPVLASARTVTRTGYLATNVTGGRAWVTLLAGVLLAVIGGVLATQGMMAVGLTGSIIALVGLYLIVLGAWGIHRGALTALAIVTALAIPALLTLSWARTELWGNGKDSASGLVPRDVLPWLRDSWWAGLAVLGGIIALAVLLSLIPKRRPPRNRAPKRPTAPAESTTQPRTPSQPGLPAEPVGEGGVPTAGALAADGHGQGTA
jgi:patatin-related protein